MKVITSKSFDEISTESAVVAIGSFDGLHQGHQEIIKKTVKIAEEKDISSGVFSFVPHPLQVLDPGSAPSFLISRKQKINILEDLGLDLYFEQEFTRNFSNIKFEKFVNDILLKKLKVNHIVVGTDFRFGYDGRGDISALEHLATKNDFTVTGIGPIKENQRKISSTKIRNLIKKGKIDEVAKYLSRNFRLEGRVVSGAGRGRTFGVPTANLDLTANYVIPPSGVYACYAHLNDRRYKAIVNFGHNPTFDGENFSIEVHIFGLSQDLYDQIIEIELIEFIRSEMTFSSTEELLEQIESDILYTKNLLC
jgi:riboflavin kinase/FMN adenylyltransferase